MAEYKINIGDPKTGKSLKKDIVGIEAKEFLSKKIGDKVTGSKIGFPGYEFEITGGSDSSGFPMRKDVIGVGRKKVLITCGVGTRHKRKGTRLRRTVAGNTIGQKTVQINLKILKYGKDSLNPAKEATAEAPKKDKTAKKQ
ncbi:MAG: 30S ribosomal protein S6e [Nanoarchaeota archaeon]|nr:30S ribosomal protein S6e [Nanoarchaeota archaeon]